MFGHDIFETPLQYRHIRLAPDVPHPAGSRKSELLPGHADLLRRVIQIEQSKRRGTILQGLRENQSVFVRTDDSCLSAQRILIDLNHLSVAQHIERELVELGHVAREDQRRRHQRPHRHVGVLLVRAQRRRSSFRLIVGRTNPANENIVGIVPLTRLGVFPMRSVHQPDRIKAG